MFRGLSGRIYCKLKMGEVKQKEGKNILCASKIQRTLRKHWLIKAIQNGVNKRIKRKQAVTIMQALARGFLVRLLIQGKYYHEIDISINYYHYCD